MPAAARITARRRIEDIGCDRGEHRPMLAVIAIDDIKVRQPRAR
jgi:hypothetical protein